MPVRLPSSPEAQRHRALGRACMRGPPISHPSSSSGSTRGPMRCRNNAEERQLFAHKPSTPLPSSLGSARGPAMRLQHQGGHASTGASETIADPRVEPKDDDLSFRPRMETIDAAVREGGASRRPRAEPALGRDPRVFARPVGGPVKVIGRSPPARGQKIEPVMIFSVRPVRQNNMRQNTPSFSLPSGPLRYTHRLVFVWPGAERRVRLCRIRPFGFGSGLPCSRS